VTGGTESDLKRMNSAQYHRGPDDGAHTMVALSDGSGHVGLGSRRLAILDLSSAGQMPMADDDKRVWLVYNGEVYNFESLRAELIAKGHRFRSRTDTEVVLRLYLEEGANAIKRLKGMFAIAIWDSRNQSLLLARDHFGVKPLYFMQQGRQLAFASEIKSLAKLPTFDPAICPRSLNEYLTFLWGPEPRTMFRDVHKLPAGHYGIWKNGKFCMTQYWDLEFPVEGASFSGTETELSEEFASRFENTVRSQMVSDVPVGAFLSAGLDSTSIAACMPAAARSPLRSYTISFSQEYLRGETTIDDATIAARTAERYGFQHSQLMVDFNVADLLPRVVAQMDEPIGDPAAVTAFLICREASKHSTVMMSGIGGDELLAGYRKHAAAQLADSYRKLPAALRQRLIEPLAMRLPACSGTRLKGHVRLLKKLCASGSLPAHDRFLMNSTYLNDFQRDALLAGDVHRQLRGTHPWDRHRQVFQNASHADFLNQMLYLDSKLFLPSLNLLYNDKMSMASSVEVRVPFLDHELAEFCAQRVPPQLKLKGSTTKYLLRKSMGPKLPKEVLQARKAGFGMPADSFVRNELSEMIDDLLSAERVQQRGWFDATAVQKLVVEHRSRRRDWSLQLWALLSFELWTQSLVDAAPASESSESRLVA